MKIESKYDIGQEVWAIGTGASKYFPRRGTIVEIRYHVDPDDGEESTDYYGIGSGFIGNDYTTFPSESEAQSECDRRNQEQE